MAATATASNSTPRATTSNLCAMAFALGCPKAPQFKPPTPASYPPTAFSPPLSNDALHVSLLPGITSKALISIGQFFDDGYYAIFTAHTVRLVKDDTSTVVGHRNHFNILWDIDLTASTPPSNPTFLQAHVNSAYKMKTLMYLVLYLHHPCFIPVVSTWTKATNTGYFTTWPGLTLALVCKHLPKSIATSKGHLRQDLQNVCSTKTLPTSATVSPPHVMTRSAIPTDANARTHRVFAKTMSVSGPVFSDQTGRFPHTSIRGTKYIIIFTTTIQMRSSQNPWSPAASASSPEPSWASG